MNSNGPTHQEIIVIKRGNEEEGEHHGGAWKIAFADFMTAMMALFLVLWLINAANEETKRAVASYFNPVRLVERNRSSKGVEDQKPGAVSDSKGDVTDNNSAAAALPSAPLEAPAVHPNPGKSVDKTEVRFFENPDKVLEEIEETSASDKQIKSEKLTQDFPDPFSPGFEQEKAGSSTTYSEAESAAKSANDEESSIEDDISGTIGNEIYDALDEAGVKLKSIKSSIEINKTKEGVTISIFDTPGDPMFEVGSALPAISMIKVMDAVAKSLSGRIGQVHILGHTDGRQYQDGADGNWRLSVERARAAYLVLRHAGLPDSRVAEIAGYADRKLRNAADPYAGENRRIEIRLDLL